MWHPLANQIVSTIRSAVSQQSLPRQQQKKNMTTEDENSEEYMQAIKDCFALFGKGFSVCVYCVSQRCMLNWSKSNSLTHKTMDARIH